MVERGEDVRAAAEVVAGILATYAAGALSEVIKRGTADWVGQLEDERVGADGRCRSRSDGRWRSKQRRGGCREV